MKITSKLVLPLLLPLLLAAMCGAANANEINVLNAWYGQSCGTFPGNVTSHVKASCDRRASCSYAVSADQLGDSAPGCGKNFIVLYGCAGQAAVRLAQLPGEASGKTLAFSCATPDARK